MTHSTLDPRRPRPGNLLVVDGRLSAVIDFGTQAVGDPACDLIAAWTVLDRPAREVFRVALGVDDDATWARGRAWGAGAVPAQARRPVGRRPGARRRGPAAARRPRGRPRGCP